MRRRSASEMSLDCGVPEWQRLVSEMAISKRPLGRSAWTMQSLVATKAMSGRFPWVAKQNTREIR